MRFAVVSWAKQHPGKAALFAGVAILIVVVVLRMRGGGTSVATQGGPSDAEIAAGTQLQMAQLQVGAAAAHDQFQFASQQQAFAGQYALSELSAVTTTQQQVNELDYRQTVDLANLSMQEAIASRTLDAQTAWATLTSGAQIATQQIAAAQSIQLAQIQSQTNLGIAAITGDVQKAISQYAASVNIAQAQYSSQAIIAGYNAQAAAKSSTNWMSVISGAIGVFGNVAGVLL